MTAKLCGVIATMQRITASYLVRLGQPVKMSACTTKWMMTLAAAKRRTSEENERVEYRRILLVFQDLPYRRTNNEWEARPL